MKKLIALAVAVVLVITAFAMVGPVSAGPPANPAVFESVLIPAPWGSESLTKGEVYVRADGSLKLEIEGATGDQTYNVWMGQANWVSGSGWTIPAVNWVKIGSFKTDANGDGSLTLGADSIVGPVVGPVFELAWGGVPRFITGF